LNIGPGPEGTWYDEAYDRLREVGAWLRINGAAIYGTRTIAPYVEGKLRYTRGKDGSTYVIYLLDENEPVPTEILVSGLAPARGSSVEMLGGAGGGLTWTVEGRGCRIQTGVTKGTAAPSPYAVAFRIGRAETR
jgi:alpha-L-fucosidase